jgi:hypothetical protein
LKIEECDGPEFKLFANDPFRPEPQAVSIKTQRSIQVSYADGDDVDPWFHFSTPIWRSGSQAAQRREQRAKTCTIRASDALRDTPLRRD